MQPFDFRKEVMCCGGTGPENCATVWINVNTFSAPNGKLRGQLGGIRNHHRRRLADTSASHVFEQVIHRKWLRRVRHRDRSNIPVRKVRDLLFECQYDACRGHDEDEDTRCDACYEVCPEKEPADHALFCSDSTFSACS